MQNETDEQIISPEGYKLKFHNEPTEPVTLEIPRETYRAIERIAADRSLPVKAVIRMHLSHGLRLDLDENYPELARELFDSRFRNRGSEENDDDVDIAA
jgi:hypothetical protein